MFSVSAPSSISFQKFGKLDVKQLKCVSEQKNVDGTTDMVWTATGSLSNQPYIVEVKCEKLKLQDPYLYEINYRTEKDEAPFLTLDVNRLNVNDQKIDTSEKRREITRDTAEIIKWTRGIGRNINATDISFSFQSRFQVMG